MNDPRIYWNTHICQLRESKVNFEGSSSDKNILRGPIHTYTHISHYSNNGWLLLNVRFSFSSFRSYNWTQERVESYVNWGDWMMTGLFMQLSSATNVVHPEGTDSVHAARIVSKTFFLSIRGCRIFQLDLSPTSM